MKETFDNYYKILSTKSEEEEAIDREIDAENERFDIFESEYSIILTKNSSNISIIRIYY